MRRGLRLGGRARQARGVGGGGGGQDEAAHRLQAFPKGRVFGRSFCQRGRGQRDVPRRGHDHRLPHGPRRMVPSRQALPLSEGSMRRMHAQGALPGRTKWKSEEPGAPPPGRQVQLHYHEEVLQRARSEQRTAEQKKALRDKLRPRAKVERKISEVMRLHGLRRGRYFGEQKTDLQAVMTATMVNSKRLFTLTDGTADLAEALREELAA